MKILDNYYTKICKNLDKTSRVPQTKQNQNLDKFLNKIKADRKQLIPRIS